MFEWIEIANIPHLMILNSRLRQAHEGEPEEKRSQEFSLEQLQYSLSSAAMALVNLVKAQMEAPNCIPSFPVNEKGAGIVILPEHVRNMLGYPIDTYFDAARRVQNAVNIYLSKLLRISLPMSMADMVKDIENGKITLPDNIREVIVKYWNADGQKIKHYRDLAQHFVVVSSDARLNILPGGNYSIYIVLPNNPQEKSPISLNYNDPRVDAFEYILKSFLMLYEYVYLITYILLSFTSPREHEEISILFKSPITLGARDPEGHPIPNLGKVLEHINKCEEDIIRKYGK